MPENNIPDTAILETEEGQHEPLTFLSQSFIGALYRSNKFPACYRILPIQQAPIQKRNAVREWMKKPRKRSVAPIVATGQAMMNGQAVFYMRYEIDARLTWADLLNNPRADLQAKLAYAALILQEFSTWRSLLQDDPQQFLLPTAQEIIILDDVPHFLAMPYWGHPSIEHIFAVPQNALYLAPEFVRGSAGNIWGRNMDLYALGISLIQSIFEFSEIDRAENILTRIATGNLLGAPPPARKYPFWMEKTDVFQDLLSEIKRMIHPNIRIRSGVDTQQTAKNIIKFIGQLQPMEAVRALIKAGKPREAFALLQDILLEQSSNELLLLSADIAGKHLARPAEAIDTLEQIIRKEKGNSAAHAAQLKLLLNDAENASAYIGDMIDRLLRDFEASPPETQTQTELEVMQYLFNRKKFQPAAKFIYSRLFEDKTYTWWKFDLTIAYARTLMEIGRMDDALRQIQDIKANLQRVLENKSMQPQQVHLYGSQVAQLEVELHRRSK